MPFSFDKYLVLSENTLLSKGLQLQKQGGNIYISLLPNGLRKVSCWHLGWNTWEMLSSGVRRERITDSR